MSFTNFFEQGESVRPKEKGPNKCDQCGRKYDKPITATVCGSCGAPLSKEFAKAGFCNSCTGKIAAKEKPCCPFCHHAVKVA